MIDFPDNSEEVEVIPEVDPNLYTKDGKVYHADVFDFEKRALSYSTLKPMLISPLHFSYNWFHKKKPTKAMIFGNIVDCMLTSPEEFDKKYIVWQKFTGKGSVEMNKKALEDFAKEGLTAISDIDKSTAEIIVENIKTNPKTAWLYEATDTTQLKLTWEDKATGLKLISYLDGKADKDEKPVLWDLKGVSRLGAADPDMWERHAYDMGYHLQNGTYFNGYLRKTGKVTDFYHLVYEMVPPFAVNCFRAVSSFTEAGRMDYRKTLDRVDYCKKNNTFDQGYNFQDTIGYSPMDLPFYAKKKYG